MKITNTKFQTSEPFSDSIQAKNHYKCAYCETFFIPNKRFVQKYCCGSCRVMACRDRKAAEKQNLSGFSTKNRFSNNQKSLKKRQNQSPAPKNSKISEDIKSYLDDRDAQLIKK